MSSSDEEREARSASFLVNVINSELHLQHYHAKIMKGARQLEEPLNG